MTRIGIPGLQKANTAIYKNRKNNDSLMRKYYQHQIQTGHGSVDYYRGSTLQKGHGFGDIIKAALRLGKPLLKTAFKASKPLLKKGAKRLGKAALSTGSSVVNDLLQGENFKKSIKKRSGRQFEKLKRESINSIQNVLRPPLSTMRKPTKKSRKVPNKRKQKRSRTSDNFGSF